jgi:hypothetical protein
MWVRRQSVVLRICKGLLLACLGIPSALLAQNWTQQNPAASPPARGGSAMVYDSLHHQFVLFGGVNGSNAALNDTWVYDGATWTQKSPLNSPPARVWHAMAFDSVHGNVLLFGGCTGNALPFTYLDDTWSWDGSNWTNVSSSGDPSGRQAPSMAFDSTHGQVVLFGGSSSVGTALADTWIWSGTTWSQQTTVSVPARRFASMSYDPVNQATVMFGGDNGTTPLSDTWLWNGTGWSHANPTASPTPRNTQGQAWDPVRHVTVLWAGGGEVDTWLWNGSNWTQDSPLSFPPRRTYVNMAYDLQHANMVVFGGTTATGVLNDTWALEYTYSQSWMLATSGKSASTAVGPTARTNASGVTDYNNGYVFGGSDGTSVHNDLTEWNGTQWLYWQPAHLPPARQNSSMAFDYIGGNIVLFGGNSSVSGTTLLGDTWLWNGSDWSQSSVATHPSARQGPAMVMDAQNQNTVLFGGSTGTYPADTWIWSNAAWSQVSPAASPTGRAYHSMVFDGTRNQVVLFGGYNGSYLNDTWIWNGTTWANPNPTVKPPVRSNAAMVYDSVHGEVFLYGGKNSGGALNDTWMWDGVNWTQLSASVSPGGRYGMTSSYLSTTGFFIYGGTNGTSDFQEGWAFTSPFVSTTTLPLGYYEQSYSYTITPTGGVGPYTFAPTGFPESPNSFGFSFNNSTGALTGTDQLSPGQAPVGFGITIQDSQGQSSLVVFTLNTDSPITFSPGPLPDATMGANYNVTLSASGGTSPFTYNATGLPAGLSLAGGAIVGECTASSTNVMLGVVDSLGGTASAGPYSLNCNPAPQITNTSPLPNGTVGTSYNVQLTTNAVYDAPGAAPYSWSVTANSPPAGLSLNSSGAITGTPTAAGTATFTVTFTDRWGATTNKPLQLTIVNPLTITTTALADGNLHIPYPAGQSIVPTGGAGTYHFGATNMPPGLQINAASGAITGTPTTAGQFLAQFTVTDPPASDSVQATIPITVAAAGTNSEDWIQLSSAQPPSQRVGASMFYDSVRNQTILFGGTGDGEDGNANDTYVRNGTAWNLLSPGNSPTARNGAAAAFDAAHGVGVLFGGVDNSDTNLNDTWTWNGSTWTLASTSGPPVRYGAAMAWDGHQIVLFGGSAGGSDLGDTWTWNGTAWTQQTAASVPAAREYSAMAYDAVRGNVVLFGGTNAFSSTEYSDTWIWNGSTLTWIQITTATQPPARDTFGMVFDAAHAQTVLFGGAAPSNTSYNDTWAWNGTAWTQLSPPHQPSGRSGFAMAYDAAHSEVVLFGGMDNGFNFLNDTWVFEGPVVTPLTLPAATQNVPYSATIPVQGGVSPLTYVGPASLPSGITFNASNGTFGGTPTVAGPYTISVTIQDAWGVSIVPQLSLAVNSPASLLSLLPTTLPDATQSTNYTVQLSASGGVSPYTFSATGLPAGLHLTGNQIVGQCTAASTNVMLGVTDSAFPTANSASVGPLTVHCNALPSITSTSLANGIVGTAYTATLAASGGTAPLGWTLQPGGTLPSGFGLSSGGVLTGTAASAVSSQFSATVSDLWGASANKSFTVNFYAVLSITSTSLPTGAQGSAYPSTLLAVAGGTGSGTYTFGATGLPTGLHIDSGTGSITGTPTQSGTFHPNFTVSDLTPQTVSKQLTLIVNAASNLSLLPTTLPDATQSTNYTVQLSASGGVTPYTFSATGLPAGLLHAGNQITGQCTAASTTVMLGVTDSATPTANSASVGPLTVHCNALPSITSTSPLANGIVGTPYTATLAASGGTAPLGWTLQPGGTLPSGFGLSSGGVLTGTAASAVSSQFSATVSDLWSASANKLFTVNFYAVLSITSTSLPTGAQGSAYSSTLLAVAGGTGSGTYTFGATGLPTGLHIDSGTGAITGTPTQFGTFQPSFTVSDQTPQTVTRQISLTILSATGSPNWTNLNPASAPAARDSYALAYDPVRAVTVLYGGHGFNDTWTFGFPSQWTQQSPTAAPHSQLGAAMAWSASENNIVLFGGQTNGTNLNQTWVWDGANWTQKSPSTNPPGRYFAGMAADSAHHRVVMFGGSTGIGSGSAQNDTWVWDGSNWTQAFPSHVPTAVYAPMMADGPTGPVLFGGLDSSSQVSSQTWVWNGSDWLPQSPLNSPSPRDAGGMAFNSQAGVTELFGGVAGTTHLQDTWQWDGQNWTQFSPATVPPARDSIALAYDSGFNQAILFGGYDAPQPELGDTWALGGPTVTSTALPGATAGVSYTAAVPAIGGTPPYTFTQTGNPQNLPTGLTLNSTTGQITGATEAAGTYSVGISVADSQTLSTTSTFSLTVTPATTLTLSPTSLPDATAGTTNYSAQLTAVGGIAPYLFSATGLPAGLQLNSSNQIAGQCTAGSTSVLLGVTDSALPAHNTASIGPLTVHCNAAPSLTTGPTLPSGIVNTPYTATLAASGGTTPLGWTLQPGGTLPSGFNLSSTGVLTGTATTAVSAQFSVTVSDFWGASVNKAFTLAFYPVLSIATTSLPNNAAGVAYPSGVTLAVTGGTGSGTYIFSATGLPSGYSIDSATGVISGATTQSGPFTVTFKVTDQDAQVATKQISFAISAAAGILMTSAPNLPYGASGQSYSFQPQWTGGVSPFTVTGSGVPGWLTLNAGTGNLTGTPPSGGAFVFTITVTDAQTPTANTGSETFTLVVDPPTITTASPLPSATIGIAYSQNLAATGGTSPYTWTPAGLPSWLSLSSAGALTGTPPVNTPSSVSFNLTVTDSLGAFVTGSFTLPVLATPGLMFQTTSPLMPATVNFAYSTVVQALGGNGVFTFSSSGMPGWLALDSTTGGLTGTPPTNPGAGPVTFQLTVSDNVNQSLSQNFTLPVDAALTMGATSPLPPATVGAVYSSTLSASGGSGSYTWSASSQPAWLSLSAGGAFSGTPTQSGPVSFQITLQDTLNNSVTQTFTLQVDAALKINTASPLPAATADFPYMATLAGSGGSGSYTWSATGLPGSISLSSAGVLLGTPQSATPIAFSVTLSDTLNNSLTQSFTLPVNATVTINTASPLPAADPLIAYTANFSASGGNPGYTWIAAGLPSWLTLTTAGYLSGTAPAGAPSANFQVTVTDSGSHSVTAPFTLPVNGSMSIGTAALPVATVNVPYSTTLAATGGNGVYTWSAKGLPAGLTISAGGVLSGSLAQAGPYPFQITVADSQTATASSSFTLLVSTGMPLSFATQSLSACVANTSCSGQIFAAGGIPPYTFSVASTANLDWLTLSPNGAYSGTPGGSVSIPAIVTDQQTSIARTFTLTVYSVLVVNTSSLPSGTVGSSYAHVATASGGKPPYAFSLSSGSLPPGLTLDPAGNVYGTPTAAGTYAFSLQASDSLQTSAPQQFSITIVAALSPLTVATPSQLSPGTAGTAYSQTLSATGGSGQYTWTLVGGSLPAGLTLASNGAIAGTPTTAGTATFSATVRDTLGNSATAGFTVTIASATVALITASPLPNGAVGKLYNYGIQVAGGTPPYFWSITSGQVPPGLTFDGASGTFTGIPTLSGSFAIVLTVVDSGGAPGGGQFASVTARASTTRTSVTGNYTIRIAGVGDFQITTPENLPNGTLGQSYSTTLAASGGAAPYQWQLVSGTLPAGLTLDTGGDITGTPTTAGTASLVVRVTDSTGASVTGALMLQIANPNAPAISAVPPPPGLVGTAYQTAFSAVGGHLPYTWSIGGGALPPGLSLDAASGAVSGTPSQRGDFPFTVQVTDSVKVSATQGFAIRVNSATLLISPSSIPNGTANVPYTFALNVSGGTGPYTWSLSAGGLPTGFTIDPTGGTIGGTPVTPGSYQFTISVADSNFGVASQTYQLTVQSNAIGIVTASMPPGTVGTAYTLGLQAANAMPPLTWSVTTGTLPPGLQLVAAAGLLTGTPTTAGSYTFTAQVADTTGATAQAAFTLVVNPQPLTIVTAALPAGAVGTAYSQTIQSAGGKPPIAWSVASGALPAGLSLDSVAGTVSGTPTAAGSFAFTVQATDSAGGTAQQRFSVNIAGPPPVPAVTLSGLPAISNPGDQPVVSINLATGYPLPIVVTATLSITPNPGNSTDLMFSNGSRTMQITIPANATESTLAFQTGTLPGAIQLSLTLSAAGVDITPAAPPTASTKIAGAAPVIRSVAVATTATGLQIAIVGTSTTLDMKTAAFHFTPAAGATLQTTDVAIDVSSLFAAWYGNAASLATGSQFSLIVPFTVAGNTSTIASVTVTLINSVGGSAPVSANIP